MNLVRHLKTRQGLDLALEDYRHLFLFPLAVAQLDLGRRDLHQLGRCHQLLGHFVFKALGGELLFAVRMFGSPFQVDIDRQETLAQLVIQQHTAFVLNPDGHLLWNRILKGNVVGHILVADGDSHFNLVLLLQTLQHPESEREQYETEKDQCLFPSCTMDQDLSLFFCGLEGLPHVVFKPWHKQTGLLLLCVCG